MSYVDGYVLPLPRKQIQAYRRIATKAGRIWKEHGALDYKESIGDDLKIKGMVSFTKVVQAKSGEMIRNYPNPAESFMLLEAMQNLHHPTLKLFDLNGKICYSTNVDFLGNGNSTKIDVNAVPSGMYILECTSSEGVQHSRIQIIH